MGCTATVFEPLDLLFFILWPSLLSGLTDKIKYAGNIALYQLIFVL